MPKCNGVQFIGLLTSILAVVVEENDKLNLLVVALALSNLYTFALFVRGNIDGILVFGIGLGWLGARRKNPLLLSIGLWLLSIKPINTVLMIPVLMKAVWDWSSRDKLLTVSPLAVTLVLSFPIFGFNWPIRYIHAISENPPLTYLQTSLFSEEPRVESYGTVVVFEDLYGNKWDLLELKSA
jgi:hypothetical protein